MISVKDGKIIGLILLDIALVLLMLVGLQGIKAYWGVFGESFLFFLNMTLTSGATSYLVGKHLEEMLDGA